MTRGQLGCAVAPLAGLGTGVLGAVLLNAAWQACDVGVNGAANGLALLFYGALLALLATAWWGVLVAYVGRWNLAAALLGGLAGAAVMVWVFVALLQVPDGYRC
ncbi:hypothetical protein [Streptomyces sp. NRRL S-244]|uniref:hypothetical protein n=1 Tax=Streptomyces sp. NRRL S-244 TaxID=1463897 RepID=UPI00056501F5|nr:hypothetical protein [Streptomyces sp. NRRL S-244]